MTGRCTGPRNAETPPEGGLIGDLAVRSGSELEPARTRLGVCLGGHLDLL